MQCLLHGGEVRILHEHSQTDANLLRQVKRNFLQFWLYITCADIHVNEHSAVSCYASGGFVNYKKIKKGLNEFKFEKFSITKFF